MVYNLFKKILPIRSDTQRRNDGFDVVSATSTEANSKTFFFHSCRQISGHATLSMILTKFGVPKSASARRLLGLNRFTWTVDRFDIFE